MDNLELRLDYNMNIGITLSKHAYTPEAYAYERFLSKLGHSVELDYILDNNNDVNIYFMGARPFWEKRKGRAKEIHEYQSLSTPPYANLKNFSKKFLNKKPDGRIFLNNLVGNEMGFKDNIPYLYRDMGVDETLFRIPNPHPNFDIVYCGSISGRKGLIETLLKLANFYKVIVVGTLTEDENKLLNVKNITLAGRVDREKLPEIYSDARFGLNFTPDVYPFNVQTSTKTLEYLASGLGLITNKYSWIESFCASLYLEPIWLEDIETTKKLSMDLLKPNMDKFKWEYILEESNFEIFIKNILEK